MPTSTKTSNESRVVRLKNDTDLVPSGQILVDQGLCSGEGLGERLSATLEMPNADYLVAEKAGAVVGVTLSVFDGFSCFVSYMVVAPGAERQQIRRQMIDELVRRTRLRNGKNIIVASRPSAAGFYYEMEFRMPGAVFLVRDVEYALRDPHGPN